MKRRATETHRFYVSTDFVAADRIVFPIEEARHAAKVLRLIPGDEVVVVDGQGRTYFCTLETVRPKGTIAIINSQEDDLGEPPYFIHIGVGILKQAARWETFLEKAVELGVSRVTPIVSSRIQKHSFNRRRSDAILIAALKQSGRSRLPVLDEPMGIQTIMGSMTADCKMICHEQSTSSFRIPGLISGDVKRVGILIGPEGGFSDEEIILAESLDWKTVWLGERRLRTETAAMAVLAVVSQLLDE